MVKVIAVAIHTIVTGKTVRAEGEQMGLGEGSVDLAVAGLAGVRSEGGDVAVMAIIAHEWFVAGCELMSI